MQSSPGAGSNFIVHLPATRGSGKEADTEREMPVMGDETLLLVDDEDDFRTTIGRHLKDLGYTVIEAQSGKKALEIFGKKKDEVDLVILDMVMKEMGGAETFRKMRELAAHLPVIFCTGYTASETAQELLEEGTSDFIQKPLKIHALASKIRKLLSSAPGEK